MSEFRKVAKGAMWYFSAFILSAIFTYFGKVLIARTLGPFDYGLFVLSLTVAYIFSSFAQSGVAPAISYFIPKYRGKRKLESIVSTLFWIISIFILIISLVFLLFPIQISEIFGEPNLVRFLPYILIFITVYSFTTLFNNLFRSYENAKIPSLVNVIRALLFLIVGVGLTYLYRDALTPLIAYILIYSLLLSPILYLSRKILSLSSPTQKYFKEVFTYSISLFFVGVLSMILRWTDVWMISYFMTSDYVGIYNVATSTAFLLNYFIGAFMFLYFPIATRLLSKNKKKEVREVATKIVFWNSLVVAPIFFLIFAFSKQVIEILFGKNYVMASIPLAILSVGLLFRNVVSANGNTLLAYNKKKYVLISSLISATLNVFLNFLLIPIYGIIGAAIATTISMILNFSLRWSYAHKLGVAPRHSVALKSLFVAFILGLPLIWVSNMYSFSVGITIAISVCYLLFYFTIVNFFIIKIKDILIQFKNLIN